MTRPRILPAVVAPFTALLLIAAAGGMAQSRSEPQTVAVEPDPVVVASKPFGESYLLAEIFAQLLEAHGLRVERRPGLGTTEISFGALRTGAIDVYPEYTGTGLITVLQDTLPPEVLRDPQQVFAHVARASADRYGVRWLPSLGFENTFAIAVRAGTAEQYGLRTLSDLSRVAGSLSAGFTPDFIGRPDGLAGLIQTYGEGLRPAVIRPLLPALKYQAIASGAVDVVDGFSTDGLLDRHGLVVLEDDRHFFPPYEAAAVLSRAAAERAEVVAALTLLSGRIDVAMMRALNRRTEVDGESVETVAASALAALGLTASAPEGRGGLPTASVGRGERDEGFGAYLWQRRAQLSRLVLRHLYLVALALTVAVAVAVPLGLALERARPAAGGTLGVLGVLQTIPSIALLAFMVPLFGIGVVPALVALWVYALYPIARGTFTGVRDADPAAVEAAEALGMTPLQRLVQVRLPLAAPVIMAGVRTAAVITVGAATLAAFIGAGGLGEPIIQGLALADTRMILSGAVPAALLALVVDGLLAVVERRVAPANIRAKRR
ncbi:MAG: glycine betaine ABC transporter substrate-binding protein [Longimicrobiales bacterium]